MDAIPSFDSKIRKHVGAPNHTARAKEGFVRASEGASDFSYKGTRQEAGNWKQRLEVVSDNITIHGRALEEKLLRKEDIWVLRNALCSHTWKLPRPVLELNWLAYCERQDLQTGSKKSIANKTSQVLPLAGECAIRTKLILRSPNIKPKVGLVVGSVSGREPGTPMSLVTALSATNIPSGLRDHEVQSIRSIESMGHNYEEIFCKLYLLLLQSMLSHRVTGARLYGEIVALHAPPGNLQVVEDMCARSNCVINVSNMSISIVNLIHRASLPWPSQVVKYDDSGKQKKDFTAALYMPRTTIAFVGDQEAVVLESGPITLEPTSLWVLIAQCATALDAIDDMCNAFKKMRGLAYFAFSLGEAGLLEKKLDRYAQEDEFIIDVQPACGINTMDTSRKNVVLIPTELMSSSAILLLEVMESNHCWNRLHALVETLGLTNTDIYGKRVENAQFFASVCRDIGFISGSDFSPLPAMVFGMCKILQGQHKLKNVLIAYTHLLKHKKRRNRLPYIKVVSSFPIDIKGCCTAGLLKATVAIDTAESVGILAKDIAYANDVVSWMTAIGMNDVVPLGGACRLGKKGYAQIAEGREGLLGLHGKYKLLRVSVDVVNASHFAGEHNYITGTRFSPSYYLSSDGSGLTAGIHASGIRRTERPSTRDMDANIDTFCVTKANITKEQADDLLFVPKLNPVSDTMGVKNVTKDTDREDSVLAKRPARNIDNITATDVKEYVTSRVIVDENNRVALYKDVPSITPDNIVSIVESLAIQDTVGDGDCGLHALSGALGLQDESVFREALGLPQDRIGFHWGADELASFANVLHRGVVSVERQPDGSWVVDHMNLQPEPYNNIYITNRDGKHWEYMLPTKQSGASMRSNRRVALPNVRVLESDANISLDELIDRARMKIANPSMSTVNLMELRRKLKEKKPIKK